MAFRSLIVLLCAVACLRPAQCVAQSSSVAGNDETIRGVVINGVTHEPIARALVVSPDNRFATLTNSEGRFDFALPKVEAPAQSLDSNNSGVARVQPEVPYRPMLMARKPGFISDFNNFGQTPQNDALNLTITLMPESLIVGTISLPTSEAPDSITVRLYRRQVQEGRAHWIAAGMTQSNSEGQFRFADLIAGTYKLHTGELLDDDPAAVDPLTVDPATSESRGPIFGYPPVYYQNAPDFGSASEIQLATGQTQTVNLSLVKQPYHRIKLPVILPASDSPHNGVAVEVYARGHKGSGFALGYNDAHHAIEGMLPNGSYTIEASVFGPNAMTGLQTVNIKGALVEGPSLTLVPNGSIPVNVKEEFTAADPTGTMSWTRNGHTTVIRDARRYLSVILEPADDFKSGMRFPLRSPNGPSDDALVVAAVAPGSYWVRVQSSRGYPASIRSGNLDLEHQALFVGAGGGTSPIVITMRDDMAEISGTVEGVTAAVQGPASVTADARGGTFYTPVGGQAGIHLYCIPVAESSGQLAEVGVGPDGSFDAQGLAPGAYRLLAFDRPQPDLEYRNPEAMRVFESKGPVVRVAGGQQEHVTLQLISTSSSAIAGNAP